MYLKLALRNIRRSVRDYAVYFITLLFLSLIHISCLRSPRAPMSLHWWMIFSVRTFNDSISSGVRVENAIGHLGLRGAALLGQRIAFRLSLIHI